MKPQGYFTGGRGTFCLRAAGLSTKPWYDFCLHGRYGIMYLQNPAPPQYINHTYFLGRKYADMTYFGLFGALEQPSSMTPHTTRSYSGFEDRTDSRSFVMPAWQTAHDTTARALSQCPMSTGSATRPKYLNWYVYGLCIRNHSYGFGHILDGYFDPESKLKKELWWVVGAVWIQPPLQLQELCLVKVLRHLEGPSSQISWYQAFRVTVGIVFGLYSTRSLESCRTCLCGFWGPNPWPAS